MSGAGRNPRADRAVVTRVPPTLAPPASALTLRHRLGGYREFVPPAILPAAVESVWTHLTPPDTGPTARHRVLPDPALSLAFACRREPDGRPIDPRVLLIGPKTRPFLFHPPAGYQLAALRLKLEWAEPLLDLLPSEHLDSQPDLASVLPRIRGVRCFAIGRDTHAGRCRGGPDGVVAPVGRHRAPPPP